MVLDGKPTFAYSFPNQDGAKHANQNRSKWRVHRNAAQGGVQARPPTNLTRAQLALVERLQKAFLLAVQ
jgi:hypothetical protein